MVRLAIPSLSLLGLSAVVYAGPALSRFEKLLKHFTPALKRACAH